MTVESEYANSCPFSSRNHFHICVYYYNIMGIIHLILHNFYMFPLSSSLPFLLLPHIKTIILGHVHFNE